MAPLILIVEDEPDQRALLQEILEHEGYRTVVAGSGKEALKAVAAECPAVVLVDFTLPDMDGREFVRRTRELCMRAPPFVLTTGVHPSKVAGIADVVLMKPLDVDQVLAMVRRLCSALEPGKASYSSGNHGDPGGGTPAPERAIVTDERSVTWPHRP